ncbi:MAG: hypothetical protein QGF46_04095 [Planctomycetota bacterium]|nr:hypothetical protein [Planctomycetota bacterium]
MLSLTTSILHQLCSWPITIGALLWLVFSYLLSFEEHLSSSSVGVYLSYNVLALSLLTLRFGFVLQQRRQQGFIRQASLRNSTALSASAEFFAAASLLLLMTVAVNFIAIAFKPDKQPPSVAYYPVNSQLEEGASWTFSWPDDIPVTSRLCLTFDFTNAPQGVTNSTITAGAKQQQLTAGQIFYWQLSADDITAKKIRLQSDPSHKLSLIRPLARISINRPTADSLPSLLLNQWLYFLTPLAMCLFLFRLLKVNGNLAAMGALSIASLTTLKGFDLLPNVSGLIAAGMRFERNAFTTSTSSLLAWLGIGLILFILSTIKPRPDKS